MIVNQEYTNSIPNKSGVLPGTVKLNSNPEARSSEDFELDSSYIDTNIVRTIGITRDINAIVVNVKGNLISASIHMGAFSEKTINPLKRDLTQILP